MTAPQFGIDISARVANNYDPVLRARDAERWGFDFVSVSDHPGSAHPGNETWTLLTWLAASTTRIGLMPRVLSVPFRAPSMVAKSAETLDRLSDGRLILGLGAGADDQEIAGLGFPRRSAGEKLQGLDEAVQIMRGMWTEPDFTLPGRLYHTDRATLEPKPTRQIPLWFGTFGPRALELTGRLADGWIPSRGYTPDEQLPDMRRKVLDAAERSRRDPQTITCALNVQVTVTNSVTAEDDPLIGPPSKIVDSLGHWLDLGFTTINIQPGNDPDGEVAERLAVEVVPALRGG